MKSTQIKIEGFAYQPDPWDKASVGVYGLESTGKTRLACTMPHDDGVIGVIGLDKKSLRTFQMEAKAMGVPYVARDKPYVSDKDLARLAMLTDESDYGKGKEKNQDLIEQKQNELKRFYKELTDKVYEDTYNLVSSDQVESVVVDTASQFYQWLQYKHFGRTNKIPALSRDVFNQDMVDFINLTRSKNALFINRAKEIWKKVGTLSNGDDKKEPTGIFEPDGFKGIGAHLTVYVELISNKLKAMERGDKEEEARKKFRCKVYRCQTNALLEGLDLGDYGVCGEDITWDNLLMAIGFE